MHDGDKVRLLLLLLLLLRLLLLLVLMILQPLHYIDVLAGARDNEFVTLDKVA